MTSYRSIVVGYDGSDGAVDALALGSLLADTVGAQLTIVGICAADPWLGMDDPRFQWVDPEMSRDMAEAAQSVTCESACVPSTSAPRGLHDFAQKNGADLIVVGSSPRAGIGRVLAGSVSQRLLQGGPGAVAVAPSGFRDRVLEGAPAAALLDEAEKGVDLLCLGSCGYGPLRRVLLGSVSSEVVQSALCPVLVVPRRAEEASSTVDELLGGEKSAVCAMLAPTQPNPAATA